jgi:hypothetical protein
MLRESIKYIHSLLSCNDAFSIGCRIVGEFNVLAKQFDDRTLPTCKFGVIPESLNDANSACRPFGIKNYQHGSGNNIIAFSQNYGFNPIYAALFALLIERVIVEANGIVQVVTGSSLSHIETYLIFDDPSSRRALSINIFSHYIDGDAMVAIDMFEHNSEIATPQKRPNDYSKRRKDPIPAMRSPSGENGRRFSTSRDDNRFKYKVVQIDGHNRFPIYFSTLHHLKRFMFLNKDNKNILLKE